MHQNIMIKFASTDLIVIETNVKRSIKIFQY